jgi:hypothetical protein
VEGIELTLDTFQRFGPPDTQLPVHQPLGFGDIVDGRETVVIAAVTDPIFVPILEPAIPDR